METQPTNHSNPDNPQDQEIVQLQQQLKQAVAATQFFETEPGRLWTELVTKEITRATADIISDKYEKDHAGYVKRLADIQAYKTILRKMQVAGSNIYKDKLRERIEVAKDGLR